MSKNRDDFNDRGEIYGKGKESRKKKKNFREHGHNRVRDFKRGYSQDLDREDLSLFKSSDYR